MRSTAHALRLLFSTSSAYALHAKAAHTPLAHATRTAANLLPHANTAARPSAQHPPHRPPLSALLSCDHVSRSCTVRAVATDASSTAAPAETSCDAADEMAPQYSPTDVERRLYDQWEKAGYFQPAADTTKQCFVIPMPPPNVTGRLHMGHAMFVTLEDIMARFQRMRGVPVLWLPGTDHAGIATQMLVERALKAEGISRVEMGREAFLERVWAWKAEYGGAITGQIRRLGASCDWSRERFTLEPQLCEAVSEAFVRLHDKGLVYRGEYMVNWSPSLGTAVSDLEVDYVEEEGSLYTFKYVLAGGDSATDYIPVATTRPETIPGDECVCVHPDDPRYAAWIGKRVVVPMSGGRTIPVIADDYVEMDFGTGALKVTPAHDINDYEIGKRHSLPMTNIMNKDATLNEGAGKYQGMDRFDARAALWDDLEAEGLAVKKEPHTQRVPRSERSGEVIEPLVSKQWFVKMDGMAAKGLEAVRSGATQILPARFEKTYFSWLGDIRDWCVSRQLWWGHRIPVWYASAGAAGGEERYYVARNEAEARSKAEAELGAGVALRQDDDVLDTWFSSGLWPMATVGWPDEASADFNRFFPSAVMETGYDILFFWVARMMMLSLELTGKPPFHTIYLHGLVRDGKGQKMSKTKGNVVDPIETIETMGTDALRLSLVTGTTPGQDVPLSMEKIQANRNFANKLWNTGRFLVMGLRNLPEAEVAALAVRAPMGADEVAKLALPERYIISRVHQLAEEVTAQLEEYDFGPAGLSIYSFLWDEYADWYLEISKRRIGGGDAQAAADARKTLVYVLDTCLRLLHPYMPFVTEEIWQRLPHEGESLMVAPWPMAEGTAAGSLARDPAAEEQFNSLQALVRSVRNARAEYRVEPGKKVGATVEAEPALAEALAVEADAIAFLGKIEPGQLTIQPMAAAAADDVEGEIQLTVAEGLRARLPMADLIDAAKERQRLGKQSAKLEADIAKLLKRMESPQFAEKAPPAVVAKAQDDLREQQQQLESVRESLAKLPAE